MLIHTLRYFWRIFASEKSPQHIARGVALGIMIGVLPKANLICAVFVVLLFAMRTNLAAGLATCIAFSWLGPGLDSIAEPLGHAILTFTPLQPFFGWLYRLPLIPWTSFNNTVVMGQLALATTFTVPCYLIMKHRLGVSHRQDESPPSATGPSATGPRFLIGDSAKLVTGS